MKKSTVKELAFVEAGYDLDEFDNYAVYTKSEREEALKDYIKESAWAFKASFILEHNSKIMNNTTDREFDQIKKSIEKTQDYLCDSCNALMLALIDDLDEFCTDAVEADGCGHFLSSYDGEEREVDYNGKKYYIYREGWLNEKSRIIKKLRKW